MIHYYVCQSEDSLWTVGYELLNEWHPVSDHDDADSAEAEAQRFNFEAELNSHRALTGIITRLERKVARLEAIVSQIAEIPDEVQQ